jgi:1-acyl-sn-glycerol-3-phosphate acyltransferase
MRHLGAIPVNTQHPTPSALCECRQLLLDGEAVVIFAEGTIFYYPPHQVHPLKPGTAWLALDCQSRMTETNLLVIPMRIIYGDRYRRFGTRVQVSVKDPISITPYRQLSHDDAIRRLTADLERLMGDVVNESLAEMCPPRQKALE